MKTLDENFHAKNLYMSGEENPMGIMKSYDYFVTWWLVKSKENIQAEQH